MNSGGIGSSLILLLVAILLLWLAVTDRLSRILEAWDYVKSGGQTPLPKNTSGPPSIGNAPIISVSLPSLPVLGTNPQVGIS